MENGDCFMVKNVNAGFDIICNLAKNFECAPFDTDVKNHASREYHLAHTVLSVQQFIRKVYQREQLLKEIKIQKPYSKQNVIFHLDLTQA